LLLALQAVAITDEEIRAEVARIEKLAAQDSPHLAVPALLRAATVVNGYAPAERRRSTVATRLNPVNKYHRSLMW